MAKREIVVKKQDSIGDEVDRMHAAIGCRAYDLFEKNGIPSGAALSHWLAAERELITVPPIELAQNDGTFRLAVAMPGVDAGDVDVQITATDVLIQAETGHRHRTDRGTMHRCEFGSGRPFRVVHFPAAVDPDSARAEFWNGMLSLAVDAA